MNGQERESQLMSLLFCDISAFQIINKQLIDINISRKYSSIHWKKNLVALIGILENKRIRIF